MGIVSVLLAVAATAGSYRTAQLGKTPFEMEPVPEYEFPARTFSVADCGALTGRGTLVARMDGWKRYFR